MQFHLSIASVILAAAASVSAGTFISPAAGATVSSSGPFNFTWVSSRYFEESSTSISVLLGVNFASTQEGIVLTKDLAPTGLGVGESGPTYYAQLTPEFVASSPHTGQFQLVVVESYNAFGGDAAMSIEYENITLS